jgi:hypothetical protein
MNKEVKMNITKTKLIPVFETSNRSYRRKVKSRIYIWPEGETILQNLENRRSRPLKLFRQVAADALAKLEVDTSKLEIKWSQKAGCSCGCSPGFVVDGWNAKLSGHDLHVTFNCD